MLEVHLELEGDRSVVVRDTESFLAKLTSDGVTFRRGGVIHGPEFNRQREELQVAREDVKESAPRPAAKSKAKKK